MPQQNSPFGNVSGFGQGANNSNPYPTQSPYDPYRDLYQNSQPNPPQFYQIKPDDTFDSIGSQFGIPPADIQQLNGVVPPPKGSFIEMPQIAQQQTDAYRNMNSNGQTAPVGYGPYWQQQRANQGAMPAGNAFQAAPGANSFTSPNGVNTAELVANIQNSPTTPGSIPGAVLNQLTIGGQPATPQLMAQNGYTFNQATGSWVLSGAGTPAPGAPGSGGQSTFDPSKYMVKYGRGNNDKGYVSLKWLRNSFQRNKRRDARPQPTQAGSAAPTGANTGGAAQTVLDLTLGSG